MKTQKEIQRAHDMLTAVILGEVPSPFEGIGLEIVKANCDVLCWILDHDHNRTFPKNMDALETWLRQKHGVELQDHSN